MTHDALATFDRIKNHSGVLGVMVINYHGYPVKTSMDNPTTMRYVESLSGFLYFARNLVRDLDPEEDFQRLRISA
ncbi:dynein light chain roadblock-type 1-like [Convolutriloba macropyga]|uniref:dynein light chain roadblock-type 1-like n=1 Tax=Convolutriloba macropyga TaxID=536237 RepID=UPI003F51F1F4